MFKSTPLTCFEEILGRANKQGSRFSMASTLKLLYFIPQVFHYQGGPTRNSLSFHVQPLRSFFFFANVQPLGSYLVVVE